MTADLQFGLLRGTALRVEYHAPAVHGHERRPGYFEVLGGTFPCGHEHRRHAGADRCLRRLLGVGAG